LALGQGNQILLAICFGVAGGLVSLLGYGSIVAIAAGFLCLIGAGCNKSPAVESEIHLLLPETTVDPLDQRRFGRLTINGQEFPDAAARKRTFKVKLTTAQDSVTVVYSFWPKTYTNIIRTRVVPVVNGQAAELDLTKEDAVNPDQIQPLFITTPLPVVEQMCRMAKVGENDVVYDIGCGDGRMVIAAAAKFGARRGVGIDIDPALVEKSWENAKRAGVLPKIDFRVEDALKLKDLSEASVVMLFVGEDLNRKLRPLLQKTLRPGARVISHFFDMGDWQPDQAEKFTAVDDQGVNVEYRLYLWTIR